MKKNIILAIGALSIASMAWSYDLFYIHRTDKISLGMPISITDSIGFSSDGKNISFVTNKDTVCTMPRNEIAKVDFSYNTDTSVVTITYDGSDATIVNPFAFEGVTVSKTGGDVVVNSTLEVYYKVSGSTTEGSLKIYSDKDVKLDLENASITNSDGSAINIQSKESVIITLGGTNNLVDGSSYNTVDGEDEKGCFFSEGALTFTGNGVLNITANKKHGICSDDYIDVQSGTINILSCASDGIRVKDYLMVNGGTIITRDTEGDGIDGDEGYIVINNGTIDMVVDVQDKKAIKCDNYITINGGDFKIDMTADQAKAFSTKSNLTINGGTFNITASGNVVLEADSLGYDPSYCTAFKADGDLLITDGNITVTHSGEAGKGISIDGNGKIIGGTINITMSGGGAVYTNAEGEVDSYTATCIKVDGNLELLGGTFDLLSTGIGGKCISVDLDAIVGNETTGPVITAKTTGAKFVEIQGTNEENTDYANPKVFKADNDMIINNGILTLSSTQDGGEGLESKNIMTINGGKIDIQTVDDCINASTSLVVNGGEIHCIATGNDAVDSNGTLIINGGLFIAIGSNAPEGGFDCDRSENFTITGGTFVAFGGENTTPSVSKCSQPVVSYSATISQNTSVAFTDASGNHILTFTNPVNIRSGKMLVTSPKFTSGGNYVIYTGGTTTPGTTFYELVTDGTYTAGTQTSTFTVSSMLTTIGSSSGGGPGGNRPTRP